MNPELFVLLVNTSNLDEATQLTLGLVCMQGQISNQASEWNAASFQWYSDIQRSLQNPIFVYFEEIVRVWSPEQAILEFKNLFISHLNPKSVESLQFLQTILRANNSQQFLSILNRSCYIFFNAWATQGKHHFVRDLLQLFTDPSIGQKTFSPLLKRLKSWLCLFVESREYHILQQLADNYAIHCPPAIESKNWSDRYIAYQLQDLRSYAIYSVPLSGRALVLELGRS
jgi:hypothetical protein